MTEAYFDESGIHDGAEVCVVAGYYGTYAAWRTFEKQWNNIVASHPELRDCGFHAKVFFDRVSGKRVGPYKEWDDSKARSFLHRLTQCIMRNRIFPITFAIVVKDFLSLPLETFHEYASSLYRLVLNDFRLQSSIRALLGRISYPLAKDTPGIQAADLLAYRLYRFALEKVARNKNLPVPGLISDLTKNRKPGQRFDLFESSRLKKLEQLGREMFDKLAREGRLADYVNALQRT